MGAPPIQYLQDHLRVAPQILRFRRQQANGLEYFRCFFSISVDIQKLFLTSMNKVHLINENIVQTHGILANRTFFGTSPLI